MAERDGGPAPVDERAKSAEWRLFFRYLDRQEIGDFRALYERVNPRFGMLVRAKLGPAFAEDAVQHAWFAALAAAEKKRPGGRGSIVTWLLGFASNFVRSERRAAAHTVPVPAGAGPAEPADGPLAVVGGEEERQAMREAVAALGGEDFRLFWLRVVEDWSFRRIAPLLGISNVAVRKRYLALLDRLRAEFEKRLEEGS